MTKADRFRALHIPGNPLVLYNVWDAGSARAIENAGAQAVATSSWAVAAARGFGDGERMPRALALDVIAGIVAATALPVTADLEAGYGYDAGAVRETAARAIERGAVGCNLEDGFSGERTLRDVREQAGRIAAIREAADAAGVSFFINARTDVWFYAAPDSRDDELVAEAAERARLYAEAGADGIFTPGVEDLATIERLAQILPLALNVMISDASADIRPFAASGVARISFGPAPYLFAMTALECAARDALHRPTLTIKGDRTC